MNFDHLVCVLLLLLRCWTSSLVDSQRIDCDPCIVRSEYVVKVIAHGTVHDRFWKNVQSGIVQSAADMRVQLDMSLYEAYDPIQMAVDIENILTMNNLPDALLVTVPSDAVHNSIRMVVDAGIPVFGFNSGYEVAEQLGLLGFIAQDEYLGGVLAATEFLRNAPTSVETGRGRKAIFVNHEKGNRALESRYQGFNETLHKANMIVEELSIPLFDLVSTDNSAINNIFRGGCQFDFVLLASSATAVTVISSMIENGCEGKVAVGTFDENGFILSSIIQGYVSFAISQQKYLQSVLPLVMATIYATTGKKLALPLDDKVYLSGPAMINKDNFPTDTWVSCANDAFPICPNQLAPDGSVAECDCIDRSTIRIGGVLHGVTTDRFWDPVFAAAEQAAEDMGIVLELERMQPEDNSTVLHNKMASRIVSLCESGVDGIFVTIPSEVVSGAIRSCQLLNVPVISVNAGAETAKEIGLLQHIGQLEYDAGYGAGQRLIEAGMTMGYCLNHYPGLSVLIDRCQGFADAIKDANNGNIRYGGMHYVPQDNSAQYVINVEEAIGMDGDWEGVGLLLTGPTQLSRGALDLKAEHVSLLLGTFDIYDAMYPLFEDGSLLFGIDQQPYLQGSLPVYLLTYMAYTQQSLINDVVKTGPKFVSRPPTISKQICESNFYHVCSGVVDENFNYISSYAIVVGYFLVSVTVCVGILSLCWIYRFRKTNVAQAGQPPFLVMIVIGCILSILSIVPMGIETGYRYTSDISSNEVTVIKNSEVVGVDSACMAFPWLYGMGFVITFSALLAKIWRVKLVYKSGHSMRKRRVTIRHVLPYLVSMIIIEAGLLLSWHLVSPDRWEREVTLVSADGHAVNSVGRCTSAHSPIFMLAIFVFHIGCLCYALVLCFQTKEIPTEFAESSWLSLAVMCIFQISALTVPIAIMARDDRTVFYFVRACAIFLQNFTVLCLLFVPKISRAVNGNDEVSIRSTSRQGCKKVNSRITLLVDSEESYSSLLFSIQRETADASSQAKMGIWSRDNQMPNSQPDNHDLRGRGNQERPESHSTRSNLETIAENESCEPEVYPSVRESMTQKLDCCARCGEKLIRSAEEISNEGVAKDALATSDFEGRSKVVRREATPSQSR